MTHLSDVLRLAEEWWPLSGAESWDAPGLISGNPDFEVARILVAVDAVRATVDEATLGGYDLLLTHHPLLLRGVTSVAADTYKGALLTDLITHRCSLLAAHTNADVVTEGTSERFARALGVTNLKVIEPSSDQGHGLGRWGSLPEPVTLESFAQRVADSLPTTVGGVRVSGIPDALVSTVAVCAGAGDSLLGHPSVTGADVYVTSDLRHHPAQEAREQAARGGGPALIDTSHWASEWLWCHAAAEQLRVALGDVEVQVSELRTDPWDFVLNGRDQT